jgi:outer membrane receptor for ferrienterochelin and colicins
MITDLSGFINLLYRPIKEFSFQPGIRVMYNSNYKAPLVYGMSLKYSLPAFNLRASYAKGFRAPSLKQLYLQFIDNNHEIYGNPGLQAETADNASLSLGYNFTKDRHAIDLELGMFYNSIHNAIQLAISTDRPGWGMYFNVPGSNYITQGVEARIKYRFSPGLTLGTGIITTGRQKLDSSGEYAWSTDFVSSMSYIFARPKVQAALFYKYSDEYLEFAGNYNADGQLAGIAQQFIAGYHTLDLTLSKSFYRDRFSVSAGARNIFDVTLVNSLGTVAIHGSNNGEALAGYGRTFFLKLGYRFDK